MIERTLGNSGLKVSLVGLGTNNFSSLINLEAARRVVDTAIDCGITLFDTADIYGGTHGGSETCLGEILGARRQNVVLATKFGMKDMSGAIASASRRHIMTAVEDSLRRLKTDWIDLYQLHIPDGVTPVAETLRALDDLIRQGKVRYAGSSNFAGWQIADADWTARQLGINGFVSAQNEYSLLNRKADAEVIPALQAFGIGLLPYFPLASGLLSGKYKPDQAPAQDTRLGQWRGVADRYVAGDGWRVIADLERFAADRGHTLLDLAFAWLAARPCVSSVIAGATRPEQVVQNARAADWLLDAEALAEIDRITTPAA